MRTVGGGLLELCSNKIAAEAVSKTPWNRVHSFSRETGWVSAVRAWARRPLRVCRLASSWRSRASESELTVC